MGVGKWYPGVTVLLLLLKIHEKRKFGSCLNSVCYSWCRVSLPLISVHGALRS